jgi:hypothetical protein
VLSRKFPSQVRLWNIDRLTFVWLYRFFPAILNAITVRRKETSKWNSIERTTHSPWTMGQRRIIKERAIVLTLLNE